MDKNKWPKLILPDNADSQMMDSETQVECLTQVNQSQGEIVGRGDPQTHQTLEGPQNEDEGNLTEVLSLELSQDFDIIENESVQSMQEGTKNLFQETWWASERAQDDISKGTTISNQFLVLNSLDDTYIQDVVTKLDLNIENIDTQIEVFRAEEKVRAALAEANYTEYLASVNKKTAPQGEQELQEYSLDVIDNSARGPEDVSTQTSSRGARVTRGRGRPREKNPNEVSFLECKGDGKRK